MFSLDLREALFALLVIWLTTLLVAVWVDRRRGRQTRRGLLDAGDILPALERAPFGLLILEAPLFCRYANSYARRLLKLGPPPCHLPEADWTYLLAEDREAAHGEQSMIGCHRHVPLQGEQVVCWWIMAWEERELVFLQDVTATRRAEQSMRFLLSDLSHELRTPVAVLLTHLEVLRLPNIDQETRQQSLHLMQQELTRMTRMTHNLLELGRLGTRTDIEHRPVDLVSLVKRVMAQVAPQAEERRIAIREQISSSLPLAVGDADRLTQVFFNLLDNAVKYCRPGDEVTVSLQQDGAGRGIVCTVSDTGPGIPSKHLPHITRRFYRASSEEVSGSGLGLALAEEILRHHQSRLEIESHAQGEKTGTWVRFVLPALPEKEGKG